LKLYFSLLNYQNQQEISDIGCTDHPKIGIFERLQENFRESGTLSKENRTNYTNSVYKATVLCIVRQKSRICKYSIHNGLKKIIMKLYERCPIT
ncbi:hypothetical protein L9F63_023043, partial [Diploptera punctata]